MDNNSHKHSNFENEKNSVNAASNPKNVSTSSPNEFELLELCEKDVRGKVNLLDLDLDIQQTSMTLAQTPLSAMPAVSIIPNTFSINDNNGSTGLTSATNSNSSTTRSRTADCAQVLESNDISLLVNLEMDGAIQKNTHSSLNTNTNSNKGKGYFPSDSEQKHRLFQDPKILLQTNTYSSSSEISSENGICPPRVNCPEKIVICLDLNEEMNTTIFRSRAGIDITDLLRDKYTGLELAKRAIKMFVMHKTQMNPKHEFAFLIFHQDSTMIQTFTPRAEDILNTLDESVIETQKSGPLDLSQLFSTIKENVTLPVVEGDPQAITPPFTVRVLLVFGRSHTVPVVSSTEAQKELESSPYFFTDVLYIHEPPTEENKCEEIFHKLCELDHRGLSYIFEQSKYTPILNSGAKLLAHPLQRPRQLDAMYKIGLPVSAIQIPTPHALVEDKI